MKFWYKEKNAPASGTYLCSLDELNTGEFLEFSFGDNPKTVFRMFLHNDNGAIRAFMNMCPHFDVPLNNQPGEFFTSDGSKFMCMFHYAKFEFSDGECVEGPCEGLSLERIPLNFTSGKVYIGGAENI